MASSPTHMLDTNAIIAIRRDRPASVSARFAAMPMGSVVMSVVTYGELLFGVEKSSNPSGGKAVLARLARDVPVVGLSAAEAEHYGDIRSHLSAQGTMIGANDLWIAAHARSLGVVLVTGNVDEFARVPGLTIENWLVG
jgi:tRNA(fMet)-specific endonuclease VapC